MIIRALLSGAAGLLYLSPSLCVVHFVDSGVDDFFCAAVDGRNLEALSATGVAGVRELGLAEYSGARHFF